MAIPLALIALNAAKGTLRSVDLAAGKALYGKFDDAEGARYSGARSSMPRDRTSPYDLA